MTTHAHLPKLPLTLLCGLLLAGTVSAQTASPTARATTQDALSCYRDANVSFLYPKSWINAAPSTDPNPRTSVLLENDKMVFKSADLTTTTTTLAKDQLLVGVYAGPEALLFVGKHNLSDSALATVTAMAQPGSSNSTLKFDTPETVKLINVNDAAQVVLHNGTNYDALMILLAFPDHPVLVTGLVAVGQVPAYQSIIQGIASTVQAGVDFAKITSPDMLCETFTNKALTVRYPSGWYASEDENAPGSVFLTNPENSKLSNPMSSGQFEVQVAPGSQVYSMIHVTPPSSALSLNDLIGKMNTYLSNGPHPELNKMDPPVAVTIGGQPGAEAAVTVHGDSGYVIAFYQNKQPVVLVGLTASADAPAYRALFEQIAASVTLNSP